MERKPPEDCPDACLVEQLSMRLRRGEAYWARVLVGVYLVVVRVLPTFSPCFSCLDPFVDSIFHLQRFVFA